MTYCRVLAGDILLALGRTNEAMEQYGVAQRIAPNNPLIQQKMQQLRMTRP